MRNRMCHQIVQHQRLSRIIVFGIGSTAKTKVHIWVDTSITNYGY